MDKVFDVNEFAPTVAKNRLAATKLFSEFGAYVNYNVSVVKSLTVQDIEQFLSSKSIGSKSGYNSIKSGLDSTIKWFGAQGVLTDRQVYNLIRVDWEDLISITINESYFKDLDELFVCLDDLFCLAGLDEDADLVFKAMYTLLYYIDNCDKEVIVNMKKEDCLPESQSIKVGDKLYYLGKHYKCIENYKNATFSHTIKNTKVTYVDSEYLFRTSVSDKIKIVTLSQMENKINSLAKETNINKQFKFSAIRNLGMFNRINNKLIKGADFLSATSEMTKHQRSTIKTTFMIWKKYFDV